MPATLSSRKAVATILLAGLVPLESYRGAVAKWRCRCTKCGRDVQPSYNSIQSGQGGCTWCARNKVDPDDATAVMRNANLEPLEPYPGTHAKWLCRCVRCGKEVTPRFGDIRKGSGGCGWCSGKRVDPAAPVAVMQAAGLEPLEPYPGSASKWRCRCAKCGREVQPRYASIQQGQGGCGWCVGRLVDPDEAAGVMRAADLEPLEPYPGSASKWRCRCAKCGREVQPRYASIQQGSGGCRWCGRNKVDPDDAVAAMRAAGLEPLEPYPGRHAKWTCRCMVCSKEATPRYGDLLRGLGGCSWCARGRASQRLDPDEAATLMRDAGLEPLEPYPGRHGKWRCRCLRCGNQVAPQYGSVKKGSGCLHCAGRCPKSCACREQGLSVSGPSLSSRA